MTHHVLLHTSPPNCRDVIGSASVHCGVCTAVWRDYGKDKAIELCARCRYRTVCRRSVCKERREGGRWPTWTFLSVCPFSHVLLTDKFRERERERDRELALSAFRFHFNRFYLFRTMPMEKLIRSSLRRRGPEQCVANTHTHTHTHIFYLSAPS